MSVCLAEVYLGTQVFWFVQFHIYCLKWVSALQKSILEHRFSGLFNFIFIVLNERLPCGSLSWNIGFSGLFNFIFIVWNEGLPWGIACWEKICSVLILSQLLSLTSYFRGKFQEGRFFFGKGMFIQCTSPMANYICERFFWHGVNVFSNLYWQLPKSWRNPKHV